jgi:hypothetical protein
VILLSSQYSERIAVCVGMPFLVLAVRDMPDGTWHYSLIVVVVSDDKWTLEPNRFAVFGLEQRY